MSITGGVEVEVVPAKDETRSELISGSEFGLEERPAKDETRSKLIGGSGFGLEERPAEDETRSELINGSEFLLEEGGDWSRDTDDGEWKAGFLFMASQEGFDLLLHVGIHGRETTRNNLSVRITDRERVRSVSIERNYLDLSKLTPPSDEDMT